MAIVLSFVANKIFQRARRPNGATQTFRRPSLANNTSTHAGTNSRENLNHVYTPSTNSGTYVPPHITASRNANSASELRYSREQLLDLFRNQSGNDELEDDLSDLFVGDWDRFVRRVRYISRRFSRLNSNFRHSRTKQMIQS